MFDVNLARGGCADGTCFVRTNLDMVLARMVIGIRISRDFNLKVKISAVARRD